MSSELRDAVPNPARPCDLFWELDPICMGSSAPTNQPRDDILLYLFGTMTEFSPDQ